MTSISSSTSTTKSLLTAKTGIGGLVSGLDIDSLVEQMTSTSRSKIAKQQQTLQRLDWKQTAYRSVTSKLKEFQNKYFDVLSSTNLRSTSMFNTIKASSSSDAVTVASTGSASEGNITINSITQLASAETIKSKNTVSKALTSTKTVQEIIAGLAAGESISLNLDGKVKTISFDDTFISGDPATFGDRLQTLVDNAFGVTAANRVITVNAAGDPNTAHLNFSATGSRLTLNYVGVGSATLTDMGFTSGQSNKLATSSKLSELSLATSLTETSYNFSINGESFSFSNTDTLSTVMQKINSSNAGVTISYSSITDRFTMTADESGAGENIAITQSGGNLLTALGLSNSTVADITPGQNAILSVNNVLITRSSNTFEIDGANVTLKAESTTPVTLTMTGDATSLTDTIKKFVEDYNTMIDYVNGLVKEDVDSDYQPLTDDQKEEMSETEITTWEKKAKSGILRNDTTIKSISSKLHSFVTGLSVNGTSLNTLGISSAGYGENGKLKIDETKLKEALKTKGSEIKELFTSENGISNKLNDVITGATKTTGVKGSRGTLIELAGFDSTTSATQNSIYDQMKKITKNITSLQGKLEDEETRLWNKFTAMETAINNLNSQSSVLSSFSSN
jgi:flagellar hook-associated protein 2